MSARYTGGLESATPPTLNPAAGNAANGVYTLTQYAEAVEAGTWPAFDPYWPQTVLLLHGNGSNGAQNNTFLDGSANNFTITRNGNTTQGTFSPFSLAAGEWSNYFDGSGDGLTVTSTSSQFSFSGDFTWEAWINLNALPANNGAAGILFSRGSVAADSAFQFYIFNSSGTYRVDGTISIGSTDTALNFSIPTAPVVGTWYHVALVRNSNSVQAYWNGTAIGSAFTVTGTTNTPTVNPTIGFRGGIYNDLYFNGYISNVRMVGSAVYTSNFTPPTAPLTAISGTVLLTCQGNRFQDTSANNFTITRNGDVRVTPFSPFSPTAAYSAGTNGGSGYFDGTGDWITSSGGVDSAVGTSTFSLEAWVYWSSFASQFNTIFSTRPNDQNNTDCFGVGVQNTGVVYIYSNGDIVTRNAPWVNGQWNHIVVTRDGTTVRLFINGILRQTGTNSQNFSRQPWSVAANVNGTEISAGYITGVRLIKGSIPAEYQTASTTLNTQIFLPPTAPPTAITNTSILLNFTNAGIIDNTGKNVLETVGNAQIDTAVKKFGDGSLEFDGTDDRLVMPSTPELNLSSGNFTIEAWVYWTGSNANAKLLSKDGVSGSSYAQYNLGMNGSGYMGASVGSGNGVSYFQPITSNTLLPTNQWVHIAFVKNGTNLSLYQNGTSVASATQSGTMVDGGKPLLIGYETGQAASNYWNGFIDDLRITKGVARYTANFATGIVPTGPLPLVGGPYVANTVLLLPGTGTNGAQNNTFLDSSTNNFTITRNGNVTQGTFSPFSRGPAQVAWSNQFDGTGDYLTAATTVLPSTSSGTWTIEAWVFPTVANRIIIGDAQATAGLNYFAVNVTASLQLQLYWWTGTGNVCTSVDLLQLNTWNYVAVRANNNALSLYVNSATASAVTGSSTLTNRSGSVNLTIGSYNNTAYAGYISNLRVSTVARTIVVPTGPFANDADTRLLTCQSSTFVDNSSNAFAITRNGDVAISLQNPFLLPGGGWANYFDGTGDYLTIPSNTAFAFGTGPFTVEAWVFITATNSQLLRVFTTAGVGSDFSFEITSASALAHWNGSSSFTLGGTVPLNQWTHVAWVRSGTTVTGYINGSSIGTATSSANMSNGQTVSIGATANYTSGQTAYISNLRVIKGTAVYTSNFTPPANPLSVITNTSLLTCQNNRFIDNSTNNLVITPNGDIRVATFSPFEYLTAYSATTNGASGYFDGTGDYLTIATGTVGTNFGTGNWTIEFWVFNLNATNTSWNPLLCIGASGGGREIRIAQNINNTGYGFLIPNNSNNGDRYFGFGTLPRNTWHHFALVRNGANVRFYRNGMDIGGVADASFNFTDTGPTVVGYGFYPSDGVFTGGYISNVRIVKGTAVYTSNFIPPTAPLTAITNTALLLNFTNTGIYDASMSNDLETVGNAQVSTITSPWGGGSMYFDGSGDYLQAPFNPDFLFFTGDMTIEAWVYFNSVASATFANTSGVTSGFYWQYFSSQLQFGRAGGGTNIGSSWSPSANIWYHIATVRSGNTVTHYVNGASIGSGTFADSISATTVLQVGTGGAGSLNGYISDLRILKGVALVPTPGQTSQWQDQGPRLVTATPDTMEYLVVAGGGGSARFAGGGGAGGYRTGSVPIGSVPSTMTVTVGAGGAGSSGSADANSRGAKGSDSVWHNITSTGGGGGSTRFGTAGVGEAGGSGSGGSPNDSTVIAGGAGNTPSTSPSQGNNGGTGGAGWGGGGGGGAGAVGGNGSGNTAGAGGAGLLSGISGPVLFYAGGGGGSSYNSNPGGAGGSGVGGAGTGVNSTNGGDAVANRGSGGGGGGYNSTRGGNGSSGVVVLRYPSNYTIANPGGGLTFTTSTAIAGVKITTFTAGTGTITFG